MDRYSSFFVLITYLTCFTSIHHTPIFPTYLVGDTYLKVSLNLCARGLFIEAVYSNWRGTRLVFRTSPFLASLGGSKPAFSGLGAYMVSPYSTSLTIPGISKPLHPCQGWGDSNSAAAFPGFGAHAVSPYSTSLTIPTGNHFIEVVYSSWRDTQLVFGASPFLARFGRSRFFRRVSWPTIGAHTVSYRRKMLYHIHFKLCTLAALLTGCSASILYLWITLEATSLPPRLR